ncbi:nuclear transport factor 2 family protein [Mangrovimicrobium sediminis]|uniref:Nuclear transport factor 2 family protein n=1 Tax=Mangrovimicrobium sediminis TaxID=2562682 RepID=A0A4Z0M138_9GAMM|nr:nuclear transport factor 2 family protein [Haliea sp. SAOS-164]TGD73322.1 nuclear transport factor 2 family protein [Haliea sp. SAOS-164]
MATGRHPSNGSGRRIQTAQGAIEQLENRQQIIDCIQRESRARDRQDVAQINSCWWEDGQDEHGPLITRAPEYAERANAGHRALFNMTSHNITNHLCEIDGDTAYCESYVIGGLFWLDDQTTTIAMGRYLDQLEKRDGEWRMLTRRCTIEMSATTDGGWVHSENVKGFLKALWDGNDPSYQRPVVAQPRSEGVRW